MDSDIESEVAARQKATYKSWYAKNCERKKAQVREWQKTPAGRASKRRYYEANRERINTKPRAARRADKALLYRAKNRAKQLGVPFALTLDDVEIPSHCPVLGLKLQLGLRQMIDASPSLDRLIPERGYVPGNVFVISQRANFIKNIGTAEEHRLVAAYIEKRRGPRYKK